MREETRKRLNQQLWIERAKYVGIGLAGLAAIGLIFGLESLDLKVTDTVIAGTVKEIDTLIAKTAGATAQGETIIVKLSDGQLVRLVAMKSRALKAGDPVDVIAHYHATGRTTHSLR